MHRISTTIALGAALVLSTLAPASVLAQGYGVPAGSYQQSCTNIRVRGATLVASCTNNSGQRVRSSLAVNSCAGADIGNVNGQLTCVRTGSYYGRGHGRRGNGLAGRYRQGGALPAGSYQQSCSGAVMNGSTLTANCSNNSGTQVTSYLDVSQCRPQDDIGNVNGQLRCIFRP